ncbi:flagellar hook-length control protein FliK [Paenibacillus validus]|uniref:flagellar hook-length control protein FliK n=1 Tax=Paenibacillus validus TaxID=44253 RepID=UPI000FD82981|nr:flagellar hook-length control protein FliK [Paenibacillus validus]MED4599579.1 flagellar hook-length control protein FliK [Paenibacillus validus]MED4607113.1 flagellar hook-length control protein FliK [Paenibacillus validus]
MEIQAQSVALGGTASAGGSANSAGSAQGSASGGSAFLTTLTGMLVGEANQAGSEAKGGMNGLSALIQWLNPLAAAASVMNEQSTELQAGQIDGLLQLLEQTERQEDVDALLSNPDLQAWLAELQALLASLISTDASAGKDGEAAEHPKQAGEKAHPGEEQMLNPQLFIPLLTQVATDASESAANVQSKLLSSAEVVQILKQLKEIMAGGPLHPSLQQAMKELPSALLSAAATFGELHKAKSDTQQAVQTAVSAKASTDSANPSTAPLVQVVSNPMHKLEALALAQHALKLTSELSGSEEEAPLFEPLRSEDGQSGTSQPMTMHDFMKQVQNGQMVSKSASLHMPASSFTEDMTQFIVSSFVLGTTADGLTEAKISLYPQHLGHVEVKLTMQNGHLIAQFVADSAAGKEMLEAQLSQLKNTLQTQGIQVDKLEVSQSQSYQSGMFQEGRQQQSQQPSKQKNSGSNKAASLDELGETERMSGVGDNRTGVNGSIDVIA